MHKRILATRDTNVECLAESVVALGPVVYRVHLDFDGKRLQRTVLRTPDDAVEIHWLDETQLAAVIAAFPPEAGGGLPAAVHDQLADLARRVATAVPVDDPRFAAVADVLEGLVDAASRIAGHLAPARPHDQPTIVLGGEPPPDRHECRRIVVDALDRAGEAHAEGLTGRDRRHAPDPSDPAACVAIAAAALVDAGLHDGNLLYHHVQEALRRRFPGYAEGFAT